MARFIYELVDFVLRPGVKSEFITMYDYYDDYENPLVTKIQSDQMKVKNEPSDYSSNR
jgi:hypothetical protein